MDVVVTINEEQWQDNDENKGDLDRTCNMYEIDEWMHELDYLEAKELQIPIWIMEEEW